MFSLEVQDVRFTGVLARVICPKHCLGHENVQYISPRVSLKASCINGQARVVVRITRVTHGVRHLQLHSNHSPASQNVNRRCERGA